MGSTLSYYWHRDKNNSPKMVSQGNISGTILLQKHRDDTKREILPENSQDNSLVTNL